MGYIFIYQKYGVCRQFGVKTNAKKAVGKKIIENGYFFFNRKVYRKWISMVAFFFQ